jgi:hypothetical protein
MDELKILGAQAKLNTVRWALAAMVEADHLALGKTDLEHLLITVDEANRDLRQGIEAS